MVHLQYCTIIGGKGSCTQSDDSLYILGDVVIYGSIDRLCTRIRGTLWAFRMAVLDRDEHLSSIFGGKFAELLSHSNWPYVCISYLTLPSLYKTRGWKGFWKRPCCLGLTRHNKSLVRVDAKYKSIHAKIFSPQASDAGHTFLGKARWQGPQRDMGWKTKLLTTAH
jgi:hypothetical protein